MMLGPGVRQGVVTDDPYVIEDIGMTVAWLMGIEVPYATGMLMTQMLKGRPAFTHRSGPHALHSSGALLAYQQWRDDFASRSEVVVDGTTFSNPDAIHVEQPKVLDTQASDYACWREVTVGTDDEYWNWQAVCKVREPGGEWAGLGEPMADLVWPYWDPALAADDGGRLFMAWSGNETGNAQSDTGVYLARWTAARGWEGGDTWVGGAYFPVHPSLAIDASGDAWVAWSAGTSDGQGRYTRHVDVYRVSWPSGGEQSWLHSFESSYSDASGETYERIDDAALTIHDGDVHLAYLGFSDAGTKLLATSLAGGDGSWSSVHTIDSSGEVYVHVRPQWSDDAWLYWARLGGDGDAEICRAHASDMAAITCESTGSPYLESLAPSADGVRYTTSAGDMQWGLAELIFDQAAPRPQEP
jgi:hypothetical protein